MTNAPLTTERVPIDSLKPYGKNPRIGNIDAIRESLEHHGQFRPLVVRRKTGEILGGNHTWQAAQQLGWTEIDAVYLDVDAKQAKRIVLADNRTSDLGTYDDALLAELLSSISPSDLSGTGYDLDDLDSLLAGLVPEVPLDPDVVPDLPPEPTTRPGDLWQLGDHRLICGDALVSDTYAVLSSEPPALVFTDPPYGVGYDGGSKPRDPLLGDQRGTDIYSVFLAAVPAGPKTPLYIWHAGTLTATVAHALNEWGWEIRSQLIWVKNQAQFGALTAQYKQQHEPIFYCYRRGSSPFWYGPKNEVTVWHADRARSNEFHPTQKPVELAERAILNSSKRGEEVLDAFGGSGSTLIACELTGRRCRMVEIDPGYCDVIVKRWENFTGKEATREQTLEAVA